MNIIQRNKVSKQTITSMNLKNMTYGGKVQTHRDAYSLSPPLRFSRLGKTNLISTKAITLSQTDWFLELLI